MRSGHGLPIRATNLDDESVPGPERLFKVNPNVAWLLKQNLICLELRLRSVFR
jgi:hypothetical protein